MAVTVKRPWCKGSTFLRPAVFARSLDPLTLRIAGFLWCLVSPGLSFPFPVLVTDLVLLAMILTCCLLSRPYRHLDLRPVIKKIKFSQYILFPGNSIMGKPGFFQTVVPRNKHQSSEAILTPNAIFHTHFPVNFVI